MGVHQANSKTDSSSSHCQNGSSTNWCNQRSCAANTLFWKTPFSGIFCNQNNECGKVHEDDESHDEEEHRDPIDGNHEIVSAQCSVQPQQRDQEQEPACHRQ
ncbi:hypothetical protein SLE2022_221020 [Rubroshorea leprosula]